MSDFELINKAAHRIYPTHLKEVDNSSFSWSGVLPTDAKSRLVKDSEGHKQTDDRNSHTLTHKLKGGASIEFNIVQNGKNHIAMAKYHKGGKLFTAIHAHEDPSKAIKTAYDSVARRIVTEEAEIALIEKMEKRIEKKTGKLSDKKEKIDVEPSEEKELKESGRYDSQYIGGHKVHSFEEYKKLIKQHHPDAVQSNNSSAEGITQHHVGLGHTVGYFDHKYNYGEVKPGRQIKESTPPGMESWVKKNKARFVKEYGEKKGHEVLYATAWKLHNKMNEMEELNELSKKTLASYVKKSNRSSFELGYDAASNEFHDDGDYKKTQKDEKKALKRQRFVSKAVDKLAEAHVYTKEGLAKQIKYHENRAAHHDSEAQASFNKAQDLTGDKADLHFNAAKGHKAIADLHRKHIYDLKSFAGLTEAEGKVEMMYLSKGFISPKLAEKLARESKHLGTDKSTGEQHYLHPQHGRMALVPHKSGEFQFRLAEEIEQLDELSPHTLSMYTRLSAIDKSKHAGMGTVARTAQYRAEHAKDKKTAKEEKERADFHQKKEDKRLNGIIQATSKLARKAYGLHEASRPAPHPDKVVMTSSIRKDLGGGYMAKTRNGHFYKLDVNALGEPGKGRELPKLGAVLDTSKHKFIGKDKVDLNLLKESSEDKNYLGPVVGKYLTHSGKVGMEIRKHPIGTYSYFGEWGAGGGHSKAEMDKTANMLLRVHPRHNVEKHYFGDVHNIKEDLDHDHPDMKAYHAACKARDEAHLASIRYRMNHDIKQPGHRAKYDELEAEHHRLRDIEDAASEKVHGRLFAHHAGFKE